MRVLCVLDHFGSGGAQRQLVELARGLAGRGHSVECLAYFPEFGFFRDALLASNVPIHDVPKRGGFGFNVISGIRRLLRTGRFDAVLAFMETPSVYAEMAALGLPVRVVVSERVDPEPRTDLRVRLRALSHRFADAVVANSRSARDEWARRFPVLRARLHVISNGVDLGRFSASDVPDSGGRLRLVAMGTVVERKNALGLAQALILLQRDGRSVPSISWIGKGEESQVGRRYRASVDALLQSEGLTEAWNWLGEQRDVRPFLAKAHALIHPSFREGMANAICEAFAMGRPVLASNIGDNAWLIGGSERGMDFDPADPAAMATTIARFTELDTRDRRRLGVAARTFAERNLGLERYVEQYAAVLAVPGSRWDTAREKS